MIQYFPFVVLFHSSMRKNPTVTSWNGSHATLGHKYGTYNPIRHGSILRCSMIDKPSHDCLRTEAVDRTIRMCNGNVFSKRNGSRFGDRITAGITHYGQASCRRGSNVQPLSSLYCIDSSRRQPTSYCMLLSGSNSSSLHVSVPLPSIPTIVEQLY